MAVTLYHGTDERVVKMTPEERSGMRLATQIASEYMFSIFKPLLDETISISHPKIKGAYVSVQKIDFLKECIDEVTYCNLMDALHRFQAQKEGNGLFQYKHFYLTNYNKAVRYAKRSFAFERLDLQHLE